MIRRPRFLWGGYELRSPAVRLKIKWADHHREALHAVFKEFRNRHPYFITEDRRVDGGDEYRVLTAHADAAPDSLGLIFTDYVQSLRASLDYLIGAMRPDGPDRGCQFPIFLERPKRAKGPKAKGFPKGFKSRACVNLRDIPDDAVKLIHWMQPYHRPNLPIRHAFKAMAAIEALGNIAKHRTLHIVAAATVPDSVQRERSGEEAKSIGWRFPKADHSSEIWLPITEPQEYFKPEFTVRISLAQPRGVGKDWPGWVEDWELDGLVDYLYHVIRYEVAPHFNQFVQPVARQAGQASPPDGDAAANGGSPSPSDPSSEDTSETDPEALERPSG